MAAEAGGAIMGAMFIRLRIDERRPPQGEVAVDSREPSAFSGWLDLLRVLSEAIEEPEGQQAQQLGHRPDEPGRRGD